MKKPVLLISMVCAAFALSACNGPKQQDENPQNDAYAPLNEMLAAEYSEISLTVTDAFDSDTFLKSEYNFTYSGDEVTVSYSVERFAEFGDLSAPAEKVIYTGKAALRDGALVTVEGDPITFPERTEAAGFTFREEYFSDADLTGIYLRANVKDAEGFFGVPIDCSDMKIMATFLDFFYDIKINYTSAAGSSVEYYYTFKL